MAESKLRTLSVDFAVQILNLVKGILIFFVLTLKMIRQLPILKYHIVTITPPITVWMEMTYDYR